MPKPERSATRSRLTRRIGGAIAECHQAGRRLAELQMSVDSYLSDPAAAPDTYREFLFRTSGPLVHEPPARKRAQA